MTTPTRPLADLEEDAVVRVEAEWAHRATGARPWTIDDYLNRVIAVHVRYAHLRRQQDGGRS